MQIPMSPGNVTVHLLWPRSYSEGTRLGGAVGNWAVIGVPGNYLVSNLIRTKVSDLQILIPEP